MVGIVSAMGLEVILDIMLTVRQHSGERSMELAKFSFRKGDWFAHQATARLRAFEKARDSEGVATSHCLKPIRKS